MNKSSFRTHRQLFADERYTITFEGVRVKNSVVKLLFRIENQTNEIINVWNTQLEVDCMTVEDGCRFLGGILPCESDLFALSFGDWDTSLYYDIAFSIDISNEDDECIIETPFINMRIDFDEQEITYFEDTDDEEEEGYDDLADTASPVSQTDKNDEQGEDEDALAEIARLIKELEESLDSDNGEDDFDDEDDSIADTLPVNESDLTGNDDDGEIDITDFWNTLLNSTPTEEADDIEEDEDSPEFFRDLSYDIINDENYHIEFDNVVVEDDRVSLEFWAKNSTDEPVSFIAHNITFDGALLEDEYEIIAIVRNDDHDLIYLPLDGLDPIGSHTVTMTIEVDDLSGNILLESATFEIRFDFDTHINTASFL